MKNSILKFIVLSIITTFTFSSCSDYLDKQPDDQLDLESVFENKKNMERWLAYIYRGLPEYYTYDGPDAIADELIPSIGKRKDLKPFNIKKVTGQQTIPG